MNTYDNCTATDLVSIIIPVYNVKKYLKRCVDSVLAQTYQNIEVLLINDGSTDGTDIICDNYANNDKRVRVFHRNNSGVANVRNFGLDVAKGSFILFVDSDDWIEIECVEKLVRSAIETESDIVCFGYYMAYEDGKKEVGEQYKAAVLGKEEALIRLNDYKLNDYPWGKLYKKNVFIDVKYPAVICCEDMGTTYKTFNNANRVMIIEDILYSYFQRSNSTVRSASVQRIEDTFLMYKQRLEFFHDHFGTINQSCKKELTKLAYFVCDSHKKSSCGIAYKTALNVIAEYKEVPNISFKAKIKYYYYKLKGKYRLYR
ncbi:glycosyltransferase family 2 protein [Butyrivibrio sp. AC2005]|uniref:glycosyltransferase family 2 protein n=1 Tax=Butyrivibrio sp. AC2005 TaxID=1280672 RepID=UPI0004234159|nr:glycosyltransferase family 2 protein [Butyrivibrio sp. AC2005]